MKLRITHATSYEYSEPLQYAIQSLHLAPQSCASQVVLAWSIDALGPLSHWRDGLGNLVHTYSYGGGSARSHVVATGTVQTYPVSVFDEPHGIDPCYFLREGALTRRNARVTQWAREVSAGQDPDVDAVLAMAAAVAEKVRYRAGKTVVETEALEAFDWEEGVCQDQAQVMALACRSLGWSTRYVSGYFYDSNAPELASHAWVDVCTDPKRRRWLSVDVTHGCVTDERYVRIAVGVDYAQCPPIRGVRHGGGAENMTTRVEIKALAPD